MYVMRYTQGRYSDGTPFSHSHLYEMTARQLAKANAEDTEGRWHERVPAWRAHRHVMAGGIHSTTLWVDEGRIRKA